MCKHDGSRLAVKCGKKQPHCCRSLVLDLHQHYRRSYSLLTSTIFEGWTFLGIHWSHHSHLLGRCLWEQGLAAHIISSKGFWVWFCLFLPHLTTPGYGTCHTQGSSVPPVSRASPAPGSGLVRPPLWHATSPVFLSNHFQALRERKEEKGGRKKKKKDGRGKKKIRKGWQCHCHPPAIIISIGSPVPYPSLAV